LSLSSVSGQLDIAPTDVILGLWDRDKSQSFDTTHYFSEAGERVKNVLVGGALPVSVASSIKNLGEKEPHG